MSIAQGVSPGMIKTKANNPLSLGERARVRGDLNWRYILYQY